MEDIKITTTTEGKEDLAALISLLAVYERDVDLLMVEEFYSSVEFQNWFLDIMTTELKLDRAEFGNFLEVKHSTTGSNGESDIEVYYQYGKENKWVFLIENKIDAEFQPEQAERYSERGEMYKKDKGKNISNYNTVLVAPEKYTNSDNPLRSFHARLMYEQLITWFAEMSGLGKRAEYKLHLLRQAQTKAVTKTVDEIASQFCVSYWEYAHRVLPELGLKRPEKRASVRSSWLSFPLPDTPKDVTLFHDLAGGMVALQFSGSNNSLTELKTRYGAFTTDSMHIEATSGKANRIKIRVPKLDLYDNFESQQQNIFNGLTSILRLLRVYENGMRGRK